MGDDGESFSGLSCVTQNGDVDDADQQLLSLLDAVDHVLCLRESLSATLSPGWMEMASARYGMGPSCISQAVFSLKPSHASTVVSVFQADDEARIRSASQFVLRRDWEGMEERESDINEVEHISEMATKVSSALKQSHTSGDLTKKQVEVGSSKGDTQPNALDPTSIPLVQGFKSTADSKLKQRREVLDWFGALVSPHLRSAGSSFVAALEILAELATVQSSLLATCSQISEGKSIGFT